MAKRRSEDYSAFIGYWFCDNGDIIERKTNTVLSVYANGTVRMRFPDQKLKVCVPAHRLIAAAWVDNPNDYEIVKFKNGDKQNRRASNLEWAASAKPIGDTTREIIRLKSQEWKNTDIAYDLGVTPQYVNRVLKDHAKRTT